MRSSFVLVALCLAVAAAVPKSPQRIIGGSAATIGEYPYIVSLLFSYDLSTYWQSCGGTVLNSRSVLTAAHCVSGDPVTSWRARTGSQFANSGGVVHSVSQSIVHPGFSAWTNNNDVAILRTPSLITSSPASIAGNSYYIPDTQPVWAVGWGATSLNGSPSEQLQHVNIWVINNSMCSLRYASLGQTVTGSMLCAGWLNVGGRDQCTGDNGGPLLHVGTVAGIASWSYCGDATYPGVYTRVSALTGWIVANA